MKTLAVAAHKQNLVLGILIRVRVELVDVVLETLPQGLIPVMRSLRIRRVRPVDQAKIRLGLHNGH